MLRCAITDRSLFPGDDAQQQAALIEQARLWAAEGIDLIQLREKDLDPSSLAALARQLLQAIAGSSTHLLINSRADVAVAASAHGVHLTSRPGELIPPQVRELYALARMRTPIITVSCHTPHEAEQARRHRPDAILFGPVFEKSVAGQTVAPGVGLKCLLQACNLAAPVHIYALGGVTDQNALDCLDAGAAGIAGIRLFHTLQ